MQEIQKTTCFKKTLEKLPWISGREDEGLLLLPPSLLQTLNRAKQGYFLGICRKFLQNIFFFRQELVQLLE